MAYPRRVLIVEDEMLIALLVEDALTASGVQVAGIATTVQEALKEAVKTEFDCAILDVHLHGEDVYPVADVLAQKGVPFVFASGYGKAGLPERHRGRPTLLKPFMPSDLEHVLASL